jgi:hypothetical protein
MAEDAVLLSQVCLSELMCNHAKTMTCIRRRQLPSCNPYRKSFRSTQHLAHLLGQGGRRKGLLQEGIIGGKDSVPHNGVIGVA